MAEALSHVERIHNTLGYLDPEGRTITIGGAAMNVQMAEAGLAHLVSLGDVDVLGPEDYIAKLYSKYGSGVSLVDSYNFDARFRSWHGHLSYDVQPNNHRTAMNLSPFTVTGGIKTVAPLSYEALAANPAQTVKVGDHRFLRIGAVMVAKLEVARDSMERHDYVPTVGRALDPVYQAGLITGEQYRQLQSMLDKSPYWPPS